MGGGGSKHSKDCHKVRIGGGRGGGGGVLQVDTFTAKPYSLQWIDWVI